MEISLNYQELGSGEPLVLLHGNGEDISYFEHQITYFSNYYRVIAIDTRGHGKSPRGYQSFTLSRFAEDLKDFLDEIGLKKIHLLGFSDGANIAMQFTIRYPFMVDKLILNAGNLSPSGIRPVVQIPIVIGYAAVSLISLLNKNIIIKKELLGLMVNEPNIKPEELALIKSPVLVIAGTHDIVKESETKKIAKAIPDSSLILLKGGHFIASKNAQLFNKAVHDFLITQTNIPQWSSYPHE